MKQTHAYVDFQNGDKLAMPSTLKLACSEADPSRSLHDLTVVVSSPEAGPSALSHNWSHSAKSSHLKLFILSQPRLLSQHSYLPGQNWLQRDLDEPSSNHLCGLGAAPTHHAVATIALKEPAAPVSLLICLRVH